MTAIREGNIKWAFDAGWSAEKYDDWAFYRNQFQGCAGGNNKAMDILAMPPSGDVLWMIEAKDYRRTWFWKSDDNQVIHEVTKLGG